MSRPYSKLRSWFCPHLAFYQLDPWSMRAYTFEYIRPHGCPYSHLLPELQYSNQTELERTREVKATHCNCRVDYRATYDEPLVLEAPVQRMNGMTADCVQLLMIWAADNVVSYISSSVQPVCKDGGDLANTAGAYIRPRKVTWIRTAPSFQRHGNRQNPSGKHEFILKSYDSPKLTAETTDLSFKP